VKRFFDSAYQAIRPQLVEAEALTSANALIGLNKQIGPLLVPLLGIRCMAIARVVGTFAFEKSLV
jgi:hypothetical protein